MALKSLHTTLNLRHQRRPQRRLRVPIRLFGLLVTKKFSSQGKPALRRENKLLLLRVCQRHRGGEENVAKEVHDTSFSSGVPEPNQEELNELLEIAHSKEIAHLGKQEEKILAHEEQELGKGIVEPQPLVEVLSATDPLEPMEGGESEDLQHLVAEEAPLLKDSSPPVDSGLHIASELKDRLPAMFGDKSGEDLPEESQGGARDEHPTAETSLVDDSTRQI